MKNIFLFVSLTSACLATTFSSSAEHTYSSEALRDSLPALWTMDREFFQPSPIEDQWWDSFADPTLRTLINQAVENNWNLQAAAKRIKIAEVAWQQAKSTYYPTIGVNAGWQRAQQAGAVESRRVPSSVSDYFSLGLTMNWEIDVFGRVAAQSKVKKASYQGALADYDAVMISVCANVAKAYINLRTAQLQKKIVSSHLASQEKVCKIAEARFACGLGSMLEVRQAKTVLLATRASLPSLDATISAAKNSLAILMGCYSETLPPSLSEVAELPVCPTSVGVGVPMNLLRRRPDLMEAEMQLAADAAQVGVAKKDFLPTLSISGSIATESHRLDNLFGSNSLSYSVAPTLSWTVFDGFSRKYRVAEAKATMEASIDNYNLAVMTAVEETRNAISAYSAALEEMKLDEIVVEECSKTFELALDRYKNGLSDFTNVIDAQINWLSYQSNYLSAHSNALISLISLYTALGGGWENSSK